MATVTTEMSKNTNKVCHIDEPLACHVQLDDTQIINDIILKCFVGDLLELWESTRKKFISDHFHDFDCVAGVGVSKGLKREHEYFIRHLLDDHKHNCVQDSTMKYTNKISTTMTNSTTSSTEIKNSVRSTNTIATRATDDASADEKCVSKILKDEQTYCDGNNNNINTVNNKISTEIEDPAYDYETDKDTPIQLSKNPRRKSVPKKIEKPELSMEEKEQTNDDIKVPCMPCKTSGCTCCCTKSTSILSMSC